MAYLISLAQIYYTASWNLQDLESGGCSKYSASEIWDRFQIVWVNEYSDLMSSTSKLSIYMQKHFCQQKKEFFSLDETIVLMKIYFEDLYDIKSKTRF